MQKISKKNSNVVTIYTDGSCLGNPGPGGWCAILRFDKRKITIFGNASHTTNNRMELTAVIEALRYIHEEKLQNCFIKFFSDSNLIVQTMTKHWKKKLNKDLWEMLDEFSSNISIEWNWVKGHHEDLCNIECDRIAVREATKAKKAATLR